MSNSLFVLRRTQKELAGLPSEVFERLRDAIRALAQSPGWSPLAALSVILFVMFYAPCFVSVVCIVRESGHWKWGLFSMAFNTALAFALATAVFQFGKLLGF